MKPKQIQNNSLPKEVIDAIYTIAQHLAKNGIVEASINQAGGAGFHIESRIDMELRYIEQLKELVEGRDRT